MPIGKRIKMLREAAGFSTPELARRIGIKQPSLWELENGESKTAKTSTLLKLAEVLHASPEWLATGKGAPYNITAAGPDEGELISIYRNLPPASQAALLIAAKTLLAAVPIPSRADPFKKVKKPG